MNLKYPRIVVPLVVSALVLSDAIGDILEKDKNHGCYRTCSWPAKPLTCSYSFEIEWSSTMSNACGNCPNNTDHCHRKGCIPVNGVKRAVVSVNRRVPGPAIHVCEGDKINVTVANKLGNGEVTTVHWHGIHQRGTPDMDGVGMITQYPIQDGSTFTYTFNADPTGTHYWHSHSQYQRSDGNYGALVVRQSKDRDLQGAEYDIDLLDHTYVVSDWFHVNTSQAMGDYLDGCGTGNPDAILINGKGKGGDTWASVSPTGNTTERASFEVFPGLRHRFRVISNAGTNCPMEISVDHHTLRVIASDGRPFRPVKAGSIIIHSGERFDFVLDASQRVDNYWMRVKGLARCENLQELAFVRYSGAGYKDPLDNVNEQKAGVELEKTSCDNMNYDSEMIFRMTSTLDSPVDETLQADKTFYIDLGFHPVEHAHYETMPQLNNVTFRVPHMSLLKNYRNITQSLFCNYEDVTTKMAAKCSSELCQCIHVIKANIDEVIEMVLVNKEVGLSSTHTMHLHGFSFRLVAMDKLGDLQSVEDIKKMNEEGRLSKNIRSGLLKDTISTLDGGYSILRVKTDNAGWWLFHCHFDLHLQFGMSLVFHVGSDEELSDLPSHQYDFRD